MYMIFHLLISESEVSEKVWPVTLVGWSSHRPFRND